LNFKEILELIDKVAERGIAAVEIERAGTKVRIEGKQSVQTVAAHVAAPVEVPVSSPAPGAPKAAPVEEAIEAGLHIITSPIVGTFYRAANPESDPFASVGDRVSKGQVLCIIEAMKLMNEIESDTARS
jgi:acetyl-CoA carboxylase biotin carboxyl carrier protein